MFIVFEFYVRYRRKAVRFVLPNHRGVIHLARNGLAISRQEQHFRSTVNFHET